MSPLHAYVEHFQRRVLQDALAEATVGYWRRRADSFSEVGTPAAEATALACRRHAWLVADVGLDAEMRALVVTATTSGDP